MIICLYLILVVDRMSRKTSPRIIFSDEESSWIRSGEEISPELYFEKFRSSGHLSSEEHQRYSRLLDKGDFCLDCMRRLRSDFDTWKINKAPQFWLDRRTHNSAMRMAAKLVEGSEPFASESIDRNMSKVLQRQQNIQRLDVGDDVDASEGERSDSGGSSTTEVAGTHVSNDSQGQGIQVSEEDLTRAQATPFYGLIEYIFKKTRGEAVALPEIPQSFSSSSHREMFMRVRADLDMTNELSKDTLTVLSGIINTISPAAQEFTLYPMIKAESLVPSLSSKLPKIEVLLAELLTALCPDLDNDSQAEATLVGLQTKVWELLAKSARDGGTKNKEEKAATTLLKVMNQICALLENRQLEPPHSEHVFVSAWSNIMNALFQGSLVRVIPGELASAAAKDSRVMVEEEFGLTNKYICGRKVDLSVRVYADHTWQSEIAVYEFKSSNASDAVCRHQQHKSVRLNGAILLDLEQRGVNISSNYPIIAEGRGLALDFYTLRRYDDVLGAGRSTLSRVWLPSHEVQLKQFLRSDSLHMLLAFAEHMRKFSVAVIDAFASIDHGPLPSTPPQQHKRLDPYILFTPSKSNKKAKVADKVEDPN